MTRSAWVLLPSSGENARRSIDARVLSIDVNRAHIKRITDGERGYAAHPAALDRPIFADACRARSCPETASCARSSGSSGGGEPAGGAGGSGKPEPPASLQLDVPDPEIRTVQKATCLLIGFSVSADWISISTDSERRPQLVHMIVIKK